MVQIAWTTLPVYTDGPALTAAMLNAIKGNINESAAAKATGAGKYYVSTAANTLAERQIEQDITINSDTRTITTYGALASAGPSITMTTSTRALMWFQASMKSNTAGANTYVSIDISGATNIDSDDERAITSSSAIVDNYERFSGCHLATLTAGSNTFKHEYRVDSNTGTFRYRRLQLMGF